MPATPTALPRACPACSAPLEADERFPVWCPGCEWNLTPATRTPDYDSPRARRLAERRQHRNAAREQRVRARVEQLYESLASGAEPGPDRVWIAAAALAGLVHLVTLTAVSGSVALLCTDHWPLRILGLIGLVIAWPLRPRLGRVPRGGTVLGRGDAPALYALADRVGAAVGAPPVDTIRATGDFNASFGRAGMRRRSVLTIGLPLWAALTPQQRVALLGHEFGHDVNGDHRRSLWLASAMSALTEWYRFSLPTRRRSRSRKLFDQIADLLAGLARWLIRQLVSALLDLLETLTTRSGQRAEYHADRLAAEVASPRAAYGMLSALLLDSSAETIRLRYRSAARLHGSRSRRSAAAPGPDLWAEFGGMAAALPPAELERRMRLSARQLGAVDRTHPPTHLRLRLLGTRPETEAAVLLSDAEAELIEAELAPSRDRVARSLQTV
ncbi:hypothetical protein GCM10010430_02440 [Kitasatospora cystarginea]|uniref:Peptidase M48 domain-containing protein n=1 Tax=Kitasatospora cystarginea TaxID=58350 RepID=A0ABN3DBY0_9ACTN